MDFSHFDGTYLIAAAVIGLLLALQGLLINRKRGWLGVFVPAVYLGVLVFLGATGRVSSLADFVFAALGLMGLVAWWASAREARRHNSREGDALPFATWTAADSSASFPPPGTGVRRHFHLGIG